MSRSTGIVVVGDLEVARRTCASLAAQGHRVAHLMQPTDTQLSAALDPGVAAVAVLVRGDLTALRYALLVEHLRPGVRLVVTLFDRTVAAQLVRVVPNCHVTSPADIAVPSIIDACLAGDPVAAARSRSSARRLRSLIDAAARQARAHDAATRILLVGLTGLVVTLTADWVIAAGVLRVPVGAALYRAIRVVATVGPGDADPHAPDWYLAFAGASMLVTIGLTALFTAGVVNRLHSPRSVALLGARTLPNRHHVVVVGLGQVGLRLCVRLRQLGIPVVAIERDPSAANLRLAKQARVPVLIAHAEDRAVLERLRLHHARALAAMGSDELDNVEVAIAALAVRPTLRIVLRAGESDIVAETRSLFHIGEVQDVSALTSDAVTRALTDGYASSEPDSPRGAQNSPPQRCVCLVEH